MRVYVAVGYWSGWRDEGINGYEVMVFDDLTKAWAYIRESADVIERTEKKIGNELKRTEYDMGITLVSASHEFLELNIEEREVL